MTAGNHVITVASSCRTSQTHESLATIHRLSTIGRGLLVMIGERLNHILLRGFYIIALNFLLERSATIPAMLIDPNPLCLAGANPYLKDDVHNQAFPIGDFYTEPWAIGIFPAMSHLNGLTLRFQVARELSKSLCGLTLEDLTSLL